MAHEIKIRTSSEFMTKPSNKNVGFLKFTKEVIKKKLLTFIVTHGK